MLIEAEQRGIDLTLEAFAPDGKRMAAVDNPLDRQGPEPLLIEAVLEGAYAVVTRGREAGAPAGRYTIRAQRLAGEAAEAAQRLAAERARTRAGELYLEGTPEARKQAIDEHARARTACAALGEARCEAFALYCMAVLARMVNETAAALALGRDSLTSWQALGELPWASAAANEIGLDLWLLGRVDEARGAFEQGVAAARSAQDRYGEAVAASNVCLMGLARGDLRGGLACYEAALPLLREVRALALEGAALVSAGRAHDLLGEPRLALERYEQALDRFHGIGNQEGEARALNNLGLLRQELGDTEAALAAYGRALEIFRRLGDRRWQARVLNNLGLSYYGVGELDRARPDYEQALALWRGVGDQRGEAASLTNLALLAARAGEPRAALELHARALDLKRATSDRRGQALSLARIGGALAGLGEHQAALDHLREALEISAAAGDATGQVEALRSRGEVELALGRIDDAVASLERALDLTRGSEHPAAEARVLEALAEVERRRGRPAVALARVEEALTRLDELRTSIADPELRASFSAARHRTSELAVALLMERHRAEPGAGHDRLALEASERRRARTLVELLRAAGVEPGWGPGPGRGSVAERGAVQSGLSDPALVARRRELAERLRAKVERALAEPPADEAERKRRARERQELRRELDLVDAQLRAVAPGAAAFEPTRVLATAEIQALLDGDTLLLAYALGEERSFLWAVDRGGVESFELAPRAAIEVAARRAHEALGRFDPVTRAEDGAATTDLARLLLAPVAGRLGAGRLEHRRLAILADGALVYVPFAALPSPADGEPLVARHELVSLPSAAALAAVRERRAQRAPASGWVALIADPVFESADPRLAAGAGPASSPAGAQRGEALARLPGSRHEAAAIAALAPPGSALTLLGFAARRDAVLGERLAGYRAVHFATHGVIDTAEPSLSGLALSRLDEAGTPLAGFLDLADVYGLRLDAELVVLSGCRTALGRELAGEGLMGLARGFLEAGASSVVASLWPVEDRATAALMSHLYRGLWVEGLAPGAALAAAQRAVAAERRWRDPYYWAGFVLQGDWK